MHQAYFVKPLADFPIVASNGCAIQSLAPDGIMAEVVIQLETFATTVIRDLSPEMLLYMRCGAAKLEIHDEEFELGVDDFFYIPKDSDFKLVNLGPGECQIISVHALRR